MDLRIGRFARLLCCASALAGAALGVAQADEFSVLYSFDGTGGGNPDAGLLLDQHRNLYGTAYLGGANAFGSVFRISPKGKERVIHDFSGGADGTYPQASLIKGADGRFFGTTSHGGNQQGGILFALTESGEESIVAEFTEDTGTQPSARLLEDESGNFYGTASSGGIANNGTVFELKADGTLIALHKFSGSDGSAPSAGLVADKKQSLYGTTSSGGKYNDGAIFKLAPDGTETVLHSFTAGADGSDPLCDLIMDRKGNLYGTALIGGGYSFGTVYKLSRNGTLTVLHTFGYNDGRFPLGGLVRDHAGNLYGTTAQGGTGGYGIVFEIAPDGTETVLHNFTGPDGSSPNGGLVADKKGYLYGTTHSGGANDVWGTVFKIKE